MGIRLSSSLNHFIDTNVLLLHANDDSGEYADDIETILRDSVGSAPKRKLWVSSAIFAELRPKNFKPGRFSDVDDLARHIRSIASVVSPDPNAMLRAARLRNIEWTRPPSKRARNEQPRCLTLGDAMHLVSALFVKEQEQVTDLEFLTFDNRAGRSVETDPGTKSLPLLRIGEFTHGVGEDADVYAVLGLPIIRPRLRQAAFI